MKKEKFGKKMSNPNLKPRDQDKIFANGKWVLIDFILRVPRVAKSRTNGDWKDAFVGWIQLHSNTVKADWSSPGADQFWRVDNLLGFD